MPINGRTPTPPTQRELSLSQHTPSYPAEGNPNLSAELNELKEKLGDDNIMDTMVKIFDYKMAVDRGSEGEKTEFHYDFVKQMCSQTIKE